RVGRRQATQKISRKADLFYFCINEFMPVNKLFFEKSCVDIHALAVFTYDEITKLLDNKECDRSPKAILCNGGGEMAAINHRPRSEYVVCIICERKKDRGMYIYTSFICHECEREIVNTEIGDAEYPFYLNQLKRVTQPRQYL
ncbi:MAG: sigma factor G inhibitor Gin, partial [Bacillus sp. (in: firmicutes)]